MSVSARGPAQESGNTSGDEGNDDPKEANAKEIQDISIFSKEVIVAKKTSVRDYFVFVLLVVLNLQNYIDRYTVSSTLNYIEGYFIIGDDKGGLIQTSLVLSLAVASPLYGVLGAKCQKRWLIMAGVIIWTSCVFACTFIPSNLFSVFLLLRCFLGAGQAAFTVIAPTLIADMFSGQKRSTLLMIFYIAIPVGSGIGHMMGTTVAENIATDDHNESWKWGVRMGAFIDVAAFVIFSILVRSPPKTNGSSRSSSRRTNKPTLLRQICTLLKNPTFVCTSIAITCIYFVVGAASFLLPKAIQHASAAVDMGHDHEHEVTSEDMHAKEKSDVIAVFGGVSIAAGLSGVIFGTLLSQALKSGKFKVKTPRADAVVSGIGTIIGGIMFAISLQVFEHSATKGYAVFFFSIFGLSFNWATTVDLTLDVVQPKLHSTAISLQVFVSHVCGDGPGPFVTGLLSEQFKKGHHNVTHEVEWESSAKAFYIVSSALIPAIILFAVAAIRFPIDRQKVLDKKNKRKVDMSCKGNTAEKVKLIPREDESSNARDKKVNESSVKSPIVKPIEPKSDNISNKTVEKTASEKASKRNLTVEVTQESFDKEGKSDTKQTLETTQDTTRNEMKTQEDTKKETKRDSVDDTTKKDTTKKDSDDTTKKDSTRKDSADDTTKKNNTKGTGSTDSEKTKTAKRKESVKELRK